MIRYLARRLGVSVLMLWLVSLLIFVVLRLLPGDPTIAKVGVSQGIHKAQLVALRRSMGLDDPIPLQYLRWLWGALHGDLGHSYFSGYSVGTLIGQRIGATVELAVAALLLGVVIAVPIAVLPEVYRNRFARTVAGGYTTLGMSAPPFIFGIIFISIFSVQLGWLPLKGYVSPFDDPVGNLRDLALPAITLAIGVSAPLIRYLRASLMDTMDASFVRTATGKGVRRRRVVTGHVLPNAMLPALTSFGITVGTVLGGVVVVESVFGWPGLGSLIVTAVQQRDYAVLQSTVLLAAAAFVIVNLIVDALYGVLDPRLRVRTGGAA